MGGISVPQLLIIAVLVVLIFGTGKLRSLGSDLGASFKGFKKAMSDEDAHTPSQEKNSVQDADFAVPPIAQSKPSAPEELNSKKKSRYNPCLILDLESWR
ncbi:twin-arginine translocase TatA/TatE family subunit [Acerihabitans sp. KWT182]|uniref:Sec-independent protein translocase protein TatA n=1 Tax=Acerihabitans sp. KWT182 TaxID=3157919 RepID=A0AAU7Q8W4_9GAMM